MTNNLREVVGEFSHSNLFSGISFPVQVASAVLAPGQGVLLQGSVIGTHTDGKSYLVGGATVVEADTILTDTVDTGTTTDVVTQVYSSGQFNRKALIFGGTDTAEKHEAVLKTKGIYLKDNL